MGYVGAFQEVCDASILRTKRAEKNDVTLIVGARGSKWRCASCPYRLEFWVCEDVVTGRHHRSFTNPKRVVPGKVLMVDKF